jgi:shikimate dehydrogenase
MKRMDRSPLPQSILLPHLMIYDTIYTSSQTPFMRAAQGVGARAANGLSMLLYQGALSFEYWFNREAPAAEMGAALQKAVQEA